MLCEICGQNPATVHFVQVVNGRKSEQNVCEPCHAKAGLADPIAGSKLKDLLGDVLEKKGILGENHVTLLSQLVEALGDRRGSKACKHCGLTLKEFQTRGLVGCPNDYDVFKVEFSALLERLHGRLKHAGKGPRRRVASLAREERLAALKQALAEAIAAERYEDAARCRDELRDLHLLHPLHHPRSEGGAPS